jgi:hypothetical protein
MAKRRVKRTKRRASPFMAKAKRRFSKATSKPEAVIIPAMAYGAGRQYISNLIAPVTSKIPLGQYADEVGMGILSWYAAKKGKGIIKKVGIAGLTIESALVGQQLISTGLSATKTATTGNSFR